MSSPFFSRDSTQFEIYTVESLNESFLLNTEKQDRLRLFEIDWFRTGDGYIRIEEQEYKISNDSIFFMAPGQVRSCDIEGLVSGYRLSFSYDFLCMAAVNRKMSSWLESFGTDSAIPLIRIDDEFRTEMELIMTKMQKEFANYDLLRSEILAGLLNILMIHFSRMLKVEAANFSISKDTELVRRFRSLLRKHFVSKKLVADYAAELFVTPNYLNRTVKKITGVTASYQIQQYIVMEAKRKALSSNTSMKEIAYSLGFDNLAHFSKYFKNNSGMNFTSFKKTTEAA